MQRVLQRPVRALEHDRGHQGPARSEEESATEEHDRLLRKFAGYWWYLQSREYRGSHEDENRVNVLFVTTGERRLFNMMETLRRLEKPNRARHGGKGLFWFCLADDYALDCPETILGSIWRSPAHCARDLSLRDAIRPAPTGQGE
jgi:hypothetical protein